MSRPLFKMEIDSRDEGLLQMFITICSALMINGTITFIGAWLFVPTYRWTALAIALPAEFVTGLTVTSLHIFNSLRDAEKRAELEKFSRMDMQTGLFNRRAFMARVEAEIGNSLTGAFVVIDIDHFKKINDTFGHITGDKVIEAVTAELRGYVTESRCAGRLGGEEFAIFLAGTGKADAIITANEIRRAIEVLDISASPDGSAIKVTVSVGVTNTLSGVSFNEAYMQADKALYLAKAAGRNRMFHFDKMECIALQSAEVVSHDASDLLSPSNTHKRSQI